MRGKITRCYFNQTMFILFIQPWWLRGLIDDNDHTSHPILPVDRILLGTKIYIDILNKKEFIYKVYRHVL